MDNIFTILGIQSREDVVTNLLAHCINSIPEFRNAFLQGICGQEPRSAEQWEAYTRLTIQEAGIPDLVLHGFGTQRSVLVVVENKLKADEGEDQTVRYSSDESTAWLISRFQCSEPPAFVFLSLFPDQEPGAGVKWRKATYRELKEVVDVRRLPSGQTATRLLADWLELVEGFYACEVVAPDDILLSKLRGDTGLEANYLYFKAFADSLVLPNKGLALDGCFRSSRTGRRYFGAIISKTAWRSEELFQSPSGEWHLDPSRHFNIHIELQFNVLSGILSLFVHYETNPYCPERWFVQNLPDDEQRSYLGARERFTGHLTSHIPSSFAIGGRFNQLAKATCEFSGVTAAAAQIEVQNLVGSIAAAIDAALFEFSGQ